MTFMNTKTTKTNKYRLKDIFITSTLYALGEKIDSTEWLDGECWFLFCNESKCDELVNKYYANELKVNPRILFDSFKTIKSILFNK